MEFLKTSVHVLGLQAKNNRGSEFPPLTWLSIRSQILHYYTKASRSHTTSSAYRIPTSVCFIQPPLSSYGTMTTSSQLGQLLPLS